MSDDKLRMVEREGGWVDIYDGERLLVSLRPPDGGMAGLKKMTRVDLARLIKHIDAHRYGGN